jgi:hypothetical protein
MPWTKVDIIRQAYSEIGKTADFDIQPEELQTALRQLDAMLAMWSGTQGIRIGFAGGDGFGDVSAETEVPTWAVEALYLNLALRLAASFGKTPMPTTVVNAKAALDAVRVRCVTPATRQIRGYAGAGNSTWGVLPLPEPQSGFATGPDNTLEIGIAVDDRIN